MTIDAPLDAARVNLPADRLVTLPTLLIRDHFY
jgi:hypothetical protein